MKYFIFSVRLRIRWKYTLQMNILAQKWYPVYNSNSKQVVSL